MYSSSFFNTSPRISWDPPDNSSPGIIALITTPQDPGNSDQRPAPANAAGPSPDHPSTQTDHQNLNPSEPRPEPEPEPELQHTTFHDPAQIEQDGQSGEVGQRAASAAPQRSKYGHLDWDGHKATLKKIYLDDNNSLPETMRIMKTDHSFDASVKLYKDKFKQWNWSKNLPAHVADFMVTRAHKRQRHNGRDTVFTYGGKEWNKARADNTLSRSKKRRAPDDANFDAPTPAGVEYHTPKNHTASPGNGEMVITRKDDRRKTDDLKDTPMESETETERNSEKQHSIHLTWQGYTRSQLLAMKKEGDSCLQRGEREDAKGLLLHVLEGLKCLSGATSDEAKQVAYSLANLSAEAGSHREADQILEDLTQSHVQIWGLKHKKTQQHVLHIVELLNAWNRHEDALGILSRSEEILQGSNDPGPPPRSRNRGRGRNRRRSKVTDGAIDNLVGATDRMQVASLTDPIPPDATPSTIDYRLGIATSHVEAKDEAVESLLLAIIRHCSDNPGLHKQHLRARGDLLRLYQNLGLVSARREMFEQTREAINRVWSSYDWDENRFECIEVMEAYMQVVANLLKSGYRALAKTLFRKVATEAEALFTYSDERAVWVSITIGLAFQAHTTWDDAEEFFERALSGALAANWGSKDGIVRSLESAIRNRQFSYLSDEGRPYKTIFGVSGITIRPGRLHLD